MDLGIVMILVILSLYHYHLEHVQFPNASLVVNHMHLLIRHHQNLFGWDYDSKDRYHMHPLIRHHHFLPGRD
jgi:hypothetical protein